jgi:hypothetical protein
VIEVNKKDMAVCTLADFEEMSMVAPPPDMLNENRVTFLVRAVAWVGQIAH